MTCTNKEIFTRANGVGDCQAGREVLHSECVSVCGCDEGRHPPGLQTTLSGRVLAAPPSLMVFLCTATLCYIHPSFYPSKSSPPNPSPLPFILYTPASFMYMGCHCLVCCPAVINPGAPLGGLVENIIL